MKITTKSRYAVRAVYALCMLGGDKHPVSILKILEFEDISKKYLEQIFTQLRHKNVITGSRGVGGGYMLARNPEEISLKEIVNTMDGPMKAEDCGAENDCKNFSSCAVNWLWAGLERACDSYLEKITIADMMNKSSSSFVINS